MSLGQLDTNLRRFYAETRNKSRDGYSKSSLLGFRHVIERYLNAPPLNKGLKLTSDPRSNETLKATVVSLKRQGKENVKHKPPIENEDLLRLKSLQDFAVTSPLPLLRNVWFHIVLFFCRRGREGQRTLKTTSFKFEVDPTARNYVTMAHDEATRNHAGEIADVLSTKKLARMYETDHQVNDCYKALKLYISKWNPNKSESFFQYPRKNWTFDDNIWYEARPVGVNSLDSMMKKQQSSMQVKLIEAKLYTNHSVMATAITLWSNAGIPNRHIMAISGHRNEQSLAHYNGHPSTSQLRSCSEVLSNSLANGTTESSSTDTTVRQKNSVMVAQDKNKNFLQSVFGNNCTVHGTVKMVFNHANHATSGL